MQQQYFTDLFLPDLFEALSDTARDALARFALIESPLQGVAQIAGLSQLDVQMCINEWLRLGLVQRFDELGEVPLYAIYTIQRTFLTAPQRLLPKAALDTHLAGAAFFKDVFE